MAFYSASHPCGTMGWSAVCDCGIPDYTGFCSGSTLFASLLNSSIMLDNFLQQTPSADNIFRCFFFFGTLRVNCLLDVMWLFILHLILVAPWVGLQCVIVVFLIIQGSVLDPHCLLLYLIRQLC